MNRTWLQPVRLLAEELNEGHTALWSLLYAAQKGTLRLAQQTGTDLSLTLAAMDLGEALEELEWAHPDLPAVSIAVDLGPVPVDGNTACSHAVAELLTAGLEVAARLLRDPREDLDTTEVLRIARIVHLITNAHLRVAGRMP